MGERTLQRRLRDHGTSHRQIVDDVRRRLAEQLLVRDDTSILEVAYEVGFARLQAFYRAFGRWTGRSARGVSLVATGQCASRYAIRAFFSASVSPSHVKVCPSVRSGSTAAVGRPPFSAEELLQARERPVVQEPIERPHPDQPRRLDAPGEPSGGSGDTAAGLRAEGRIRPALDGGIGSDLVERVGSLARAAWSSVAPGATLAREESFARLHAGTVLVDWGSTGREGSTRTP